MPAGWPVSCIHRDRLSLPLTHTLCNLDRAEKPAFYSPNGSRELDASSTKFNVVERIFLLFSLSDKRLTLFSLSLFLFSLKNLKLNSNVIATKLLIMVSMCENASFITTFRNFCFLKGFNEDHCVYMLVR